MEHKILFIMISHWFFYFLGTDKLSPAPYCGCFAQSTLKDYWLSLWLTPLVIHTSKPQGRDTQKDHRSGPLSTSIPLAPGYSQRPVAR